MPVQFAEISRTEEALQGYTKSHITVEVRPQGEGQGLPDKNTTKGDLYDFFGEDATVDEVLHLHGGVWLVVTSAEKIEEVSK